MDYRSTLYRYSTGKGFSVNVDVPDEETSYAAFKMDPLETPYVTPETPIDLTREADNVSMQLEAAEQQVKILGYNTDASKKVSRLKNRVELIRHLLQNYPIKKVKYRDLQNLYDAYQKDTRSIDSLVQKVLAYQKEAAADFVDVAAKVRKGYAVYDQYGKVVKNLEGLGDSQQPGKLPAYVKWGAIGLVLFLVVMRLSK